MQKKMSLLLSKLWLGHYCGNLKIRYIAIADHKLKQLEKSKFTKTN